MFNIGDYRRKLGYGGVDKSFFEGGNEEGQRIRAKMVQVRCMVVASCSPLPCCAYEYVSLCRGGALLRFAPLRCDNSFMWYALVVMWCGKPSSVRDIARPQFAGASSNR